MIVPKWLFASGLAAVSLAAVSLAAVLLAVGGCAGNSVSSEDPPVQRVDVTNAGDSKAPPTGPDQYWVKLETTKGDVIIEVTRNWSPYGADRFYELVKDGFYNDCRLFRVISGFVVQTGINGKPSVHAKWKDRNIPDDHFPPNDANRQSNKRGYVSFAKSGMPNSRSTQIFINTKGNQQLDGMGFTPFGKVIGGMDVVDAFYDGYNEEPQRSADRIEAEGNAYLDKAFPKLDSIKKAVLLEKKPEPAKEPAG